MVQDPERGRVVLDAEVLCDQLHRGCHFNLNYLLTSHFQRTIPIFLEKQVGVLSIVLFRPPPVDPRS